MAGVAWLVLAPVFKTGGARREALLGGFDSHRLPLPGSALKLQGGFFGYGVGFRAMGFDWFRLKGAETG